MPQRKADSGLDFEALRRGIERCDPDLVLGFYAEDAQLSIVNVVTPHVSPFELCGKAEIAKHLRATFGQEASHRVEREVVGEDRVTYWEECEYPDGGRVLVETTLDVHDGKIVRQVDVVATNPQAERDAGVGQRPPKTPIRRPTQGRRRPCQTAFYAPSRQPKRRKGHGEANRRDPVGRDVSAGPSRFGALGRHGEHRRVRGVGVGTPPQRP